MRGEGGSPAITVPFFLFFFFFSFLFPVLGVVTDDALHVALLVTDDKNLAQGELFVKEQ